MSLSDDLISQFVKVTNDKTEVKKETTLYGTTVVHDGVTYVKIDGSELLTPVTTTTNTQSGERVTVMIKNHSATITGNISSPSARTDDLKSVANDTSEHGTKISEFEIALGKKAEVDELRAETARINTLVSENATIKQNLATASADIGTLKANEATITEQLNVNKANIETLQTAKLDAKIAEATYATIENLNAANADINNLRVTYGNFVVLSANKFEALEAEIAKLEAGEISVEQLKATFATIVQLEAEQARITKLEGDLAEIDTLIFGSATGSTIQASFANAVIAQLSDAQIKSAMIQNVSADKITSGDVITNNVRVMSEDGKMLISDETIQISDNTRVRVQIGKDASGDYSINVWDADGNLMFSEGGITDKAIKQAIIRNDMVSENANISAYKLDVNSLFEVINGSSNTIKATRIYIDGQTQSLEVAFTSLTNKVDNLGNSVTSQGTQITAIQGQIASKIWQNDINTAVDKVGNETETLSTQYSELQQELNGVKTTVASHTSALSTKADKTQVTEVSTKVTSLETNLSGFKTTVSDTYATKTALTDLQSNIDNLSIGGRNLLRNSTSLRGFSAAEGITFSTTDEGYLQVVAASGNSNWFSLGIGSDHTQLEAELAEGDEYTISFTMRSPDSTYIPSIYIKPNMGYYNMLGTLSSEWSTVWYSGIWKDSGNILFHLGFGNRVGTYEIKNCKIERGNRPTDWSPAPEDMATASRMTEAETKINQNAEAINLRATKTEVTQAVDSISVGGQNLVATKRFQEARNVSSTKEFTLSNAWATTFISNANLIEILEPGTEYTVRYELELTGRTEVPTKFDMMVGFLIYSNAHATWISLATNMSETADIGTKQVVQKTFTTPEAWNDESLIGYSRRWTTEGSEPVGFDTFKVTNFKIEKGNKATDWSPAVDDMAAVDDLAVIQSTSDLIEERVTTAESLIDILSNNISMLVTDSNGESLMSQTSTGWTFSTEQIQNTVNSTSESLNNLVNEVEDIDSAVGVLQQAVDDLGAIGEYVKIGTYEDEPCIELGEGDSDFKLLITNTRIIFMEGTDNVAYINNQSLYIKKAVIEEELQQGEFVWKARSNGNLGLIWKGAI